MTERLAPPHAGLACAHELFELQAERTPGRVALTFERTDLTYFELNRRANNVAHHLRSLGVGPETLVGVALDRSTELVVALLGILKAGAAYVPLDPDYPRERLAFMLDDARVPVVIVRGSEQSFRANDRQTVSIDAVLAQCASKPEYQANPESGVTPANVAYVIYTSGSTGKPKGVEVEHRSLTNFLLSMKAEPGLSDSDVLVAVTSVSFDIAGLELYLPLVVGARLVITSAGVARDADRLGQVFVGSGATVVQATPTTWQMLVSAGWQGSSRLRILCGGEPLSRKLATQLLERSLALYNLYGPTETTIWSTLAQIRTPDEPITVGLPIANTDLYVVPEGAPAGGLTRVAQGEVGELCIGGLGVARGYLRRPELTSDRFLADPFRGGDARIYRTGDLARQLADGRIELLGRLDRQVKIRGNRVELPEIESVLVQHPSVEECVVLGQPGPNGAARLVAYIVTKSLPAPESPDDTTAKWQKVWSEVYRSAVGADVATFRTAGWNDSVTGLPMTLEEVGEWADRTSERILALRPKRVLEIGCGNGLVLRRVAPECASYVGLDITPEAVAHLQGELAREGRWAHVEVRQGSADELDSLPIGKFDCIVVNSVMQYFPDVAYAVRVLEAALRKVEPGGSIFVGDVRSLPLLEAFHTSVELSASPASLATHELHQRIREGVHREKELVVEPGLFEAFAAANPAVTAVEIRLKRGRHPNELTRFRYDVVLRRGESGVVEHPPKGELTDWTGALSLASLPAWLGRQTADTLTLARIPNARVARELAALDAIAGPQPPATVAGLEAIARASAHSAVDPEELCLIAERLSFDVRLSWSTEEGSFDATLTRRTPAERERPAAATPPVSMLNGHRTEVRAWSSYANDPSRATSTQHLARTLRGFLRQQLPDGMIPSHFVTVDQMPRTPGGKLDVAALAAIEVAPDRRDEVPIAPRDATERLLVEIWEDVLAVDGIGVGDDFGELGGDSLLAVEIMARLEKVLRKSLSLASIFGTHGLTVAKQAAIIRAQGEQASPGRVSVVALQPGGPKPALFFASTPMNLFRYMQADQPLYDLNIPAVHDQSYSPDVIEKTVDECVDAIRRVQPRGPYFVGGHCFGGLLMLEVALRLQATQHEVALLILVDPDPADDVPIAARIVHHLRELNRLTVKEKAVLFRQKTGTLVGALRKMVGGRSKEAADYGSLYQARWGKEHWTQPFPTALFLSRPKYDRQDDAIPLWEKRALRELTIVDLPGDRYTLFTEPHVRVAAEKLTRCLELAQSAARASRLESQGPDQVET